jgi:hypothetical protein
MGKQFRALNSQDISEMLCEKIEIFINLFGMCGIDLWAFDHLCDEQTKILEDLRIHQYDVQDIQNLLYFLIASNAPAMRVCLIKNEMKWNGLEWNEMKWNEME